MKRQRQPRKTYDQRNEQRTIAPKETGFIRAFSVMRPVLFEPGQAKRLEKTISRTFKEELPHTVRSAFDIIPPKEWCVVMNSQNRLVDQMREQGVSLRKTEAMQKVGALSSSLKRTLGYQELYFDPMPVSQAQQCSDRDIGFAFNGWNKARTGVAVDDEQRPEVVTAQITPLAVLATQHAVTQRFITDLFAEHGQQNEVTGPYVPPEHTPYIAVLHNKRGFKHEQFQQIAPVLSALVIEAALGCPMINFRLDRTDERPYPAIVQPQGHLPQILQAA